MDSIDSDVIKKYDKFDLPKLKKKAQEVFNKFIRLRDSENGYFTCISCQQTKDNSQLNAGHYLSMGHHQSLRYNEFNTNSQCLKCNMYLSGNLINYRIGLIKKVGLEKVEELESIGSRVHKWDRYSLIFIIETYKQKIKSL